MRLKAWVWLGVWCVASTAGAQEGALVWPPDIPADSIAVKVPVPVELRGAVEAMEGGRYAAAAAELREIVRRDSTRVRALRLLASSYVKMGANVQAMDACRRVAALDSADAGGPIALGYLYQEQGDFETAERFYLEAIGRNPDVVQAYQGLGWIYLQRRQLEQALEMATRTSVATPDYAPNYVLMGRVLTAQGFYEDAADAYRRAFSLNPGLRGQYGILLQELAIRHRLIR